MNYDSLVSIFLISIASTADTHLYTSIYEVETRLNVYLHYVQYIIIHVTRNNSI